MQQNAPCGGQSSSVWPTSSWARRSAGCRAAVRGAGGGPHGGPDPVLFVLDWLEPAPATAGRPRRFWALGFRAHERA